MGIVVIMLSVVMLILLITVILKLKNPHAALEFRLNDITNTINDIKTEQLKFQKDSLLEQQTLFGKTQDSIISQLEKSTTVVGDIQKNLGSLEITAKNIQDIGSNISSLQEILQAPKLRGNLGEYLLEDLLKNILPASNYGVKYSFKNGTQVDAIIKLKDGIIPIDSKFPLESFSRMIKATCDEDKKKFKREFISSVKTKIDEIANKYINPSEETFDFAMMYIPAENVYYETIISDSNMDYEIFNYAIKKQVVIVSPNSFWAYLMAIAYGLKGFAIEAHAKHIRSECANIQIVFNKMYEDVLVTGKHLNNALSKYDDCVKKTEKLGGMIKQISSGGE